MERIKHLGYLFFKEPFERGLIKGIADIILKVFFLIMWVIMASVAISIMLEVFTVEYNAARIVWWAAYCLMIFIGVSLIAYVGIFSRREYK